MGACCTKVRHLSSVGSPEWRHRLSGHPLFRLVYMLLFIVVLLVRDPARYGSASTESTLGLLSWRIVTVMWTACLRLDIERLMDKWISPLD